jgi:hypothetical protein
MTKSGTGLLGVWMGPSAEHEADLNRWYADEHLPDRMEIPGFLRARRYESAQGEPKYVAIYDLEDAQVLASDAYMTIAKNPTPWTQQVTGALQFFLRNEYELVQSIGESQDDAPYMLLVRIETGPEHLDELDRWYTEEHLPALAAVPGVIAARRYRATVGSPLYLATYELESPEVRTSEAWSMAGNTSWTDRMRPLWRNNAANLGKLIAVKTK